MEDKTPMELMEELEEKRRKYSVTMTEISEEANKNNGAYSRALCDKRLRFATYLKYARALERILDRRRETLKELHI